jgi:hypothetical protein
VPQQKLPLHHILIERLAFGICMVELLNGLGKRSEKGKRREGRKSRPHGLPLPTFFQTGFHPLRTNQEILVAALDAYLDSKD